MLHSDDTIVAVATPAGQGGISVTRVSGPEAFNVSEKIFRAKKGKLGEFASHTLHFGEIVNEDGELLDEAVAGIFRAPHSYTGEDVVEISSHGGAAVTKEIVDLLARAGARHAEPGEFTKRAFLNGRMDLTQAEAVLDIIRAKSSKSLQTAMRQLKGGLSSKLKSLKEDLMLLYANLEASLDFPDEKLETDSGSAITDKIQNLSAEIRKLLATFKRNAVLREGLIVVITGKPNVGKSSLFNALLGRERALVSEYPGTTRDRLEETLEIDGVAIRLMDTAGLAGNAAHPLDQMGMENTRRTLEEAELFIYMVDGSHPLEEEDKQAFREMENRSAETPLVVVINKSDLEAKINSAELSKLTSGKSFEKISAKTGAGLEQIEKKISEVLAAQTEDSGGEQITRVRHKNALEAALASLASAKDAVSRGESLEFVVEDLKAALERLRELIGEVYCEDLLDVIFREFCIGK